MAAGAADASVGSTFSAAVSSTCVAVISDSMTGRKDERTLVSFFAFGLGERALRI